MQRLPLIASILISCALAFAGSPARADVTVVMRGSYSVTPGVPLDPRATSLINSGLNPTIYLKGNSWRVDSEDIIQICDTTHNRVMTINKARGIYCITKRGRAQDRAIARLFNLPDNGGSDWRLGTVRRTVERIHYAGHRCVRYTATAALHKTGYYDITYRIEEIDALDIKGFKRQRTREGKVTVPGVTLKLVYEMAGPAGELIAQTQAVSISSAPLAASTFAVGKNFRLASLEEVVGSDDGGSSVEIPTGLMSDRPVDPYAGLNQFTGFSKAQALVKAGRFDDAAAVARSLAGRGLNTQLGPVYVALGDHADSVGKPDEAWGWYSLVLSTDNDTADLVRAHRGIAAYYIGIHDVRDAQKQLQAILDLPDAGQGDKDQARTALEQLAK